MKDLKKNKFKILLVLVAIISMFSIKNVTADSGFDTGYSGSSSSSSSSSSSHSSSSSSYSSYDDGSSSNYMDPALGFTIAIIMIAITIYAFISAYNASKKYQRQDYLDHNKEVPEDKIKKYLKDYNEDKFKRARFNDFVKIQNAWTDFDYDALRSMLTDELYNQYEMQLETLKASGEVNKMDDFILDDGMITDINEENDKITVKTEFVIRFKDYIEKNGKVVRGNSKERIVQHYEMTFVCNKKDKIDKCPNCGAKLTKSSSQKCKYCGSVISRVSNKFVLAKKESIWQGIDL